MTIKTVARRDSATALLRKLGVAQADYAKFITVLADGRVQVDLALAAASLKTTAQDPSVVTDVEEKPPVMREAQGETVRHDVPQGRVLPDTVRADEEPATTAPVGNPFDALIKQPSKKSISVAPTKPAKKPAAKKAAKTSKPAAKAVKAPKAPKEAKRTCSSVARELIRAGKTNAEVWEVIQPEFELKDSQKYYPGWYRFELRRKGEQV